MKRRLFGNKIFASALVLTLLAGGLGAGMQTKAAESDKKLVIKKVLNLPAEGVTTPTETFTFKFDKHSKNGKEDLKDSLPNITDRTVSYGSNDNTDNDTTTNGKQVIKLTDNALTGVTFQDAGQYTYRVSEQAGTTTDMSYSKATYLVSVFTKTDTSGAIVVDTIQIKKEKDDKGTNIDNPTKTEYKPGTDGGSDNGQGNNFVFENNYDKKGGNNNSGGTDITEADKKGFVLKKEIKGETSPNLDERFKFTIRASLPTGTHSTETTFTYYTVNAQGTKGDNQTGTYGTDFDVTLKHGERVVFGSVLLGSKVSAKEVVDGGYQQGINSGSKLNGQAVSTVEALSNGMSIGEAGDNSIIFENTQQTPTGILLNNLPFIVLVAIAGLGIIFFVKSRREEEELEA